MAKKTLLIFLSLMLLILPIQQQKAKAVGPLAIPLGIEIGVGAYVAGALAIAGIAGVMGYSQYSEEINAHAKRSWDNANEVVKDSIKTSVDVAVQAGSSTIQLGNDFLDWYSNTFVPSLSGALSKNPEVVELEYIEGGWSITRKADSVEIFFPGTITLIHWTGSELAEHPNSIIVRSNGFVSTPKAGLNSSGKWSPNLNGSISSLFHSAMSAVVAEGSYSYKWDAGYVPPPTTVPVDHYAQQVGDRVERVMDYSSNKGISLPINDIVPYAGSPSVPLTWDQDGQAYKLPDGSLYNPALDGSIGWSYPVPRVVTDEAGAVVSDPATSIPRTEVTTGDGVISDPITGEFDLPDTLVPPMEGVPSPNDRVHQPKDINWKKLIGAFGAFTYIFPFSIPWDIGRAMDSIFGGFNQGIEPKWDVELAGMEFVLEIPDVFLDWVPILRTFLIITFDIGVIYALRKWFGGAT